MDAGGGGATGRGGCRFGRAARWDRVVCNDTGTGPYRGARGLQMRFRMVWALVCEMPLPTRRALPDALNTSSFQ